MNVPDWWTLVLLGLAAYRIFRLIGVDTVLDVPRAWLVGLAGWQEGRPTPAGYRQGLAEFLVCPWCLGFWTAFAWWGSWQLWPHGSLVVAAPFAISALVGLIAEAVGE
jgi:hypothetical protein